MEKGSQSGRLFIKKSVDQIQRESLNHSLKRTLGRWNLLFLGIGCIIGAGIYVMTGSAAANFAGPAVLLSFVVAGTACAFAGLCYAELASSMPVAGSAYTYSYATMGEVFAWVMGWLLVLEYGVAAATVAVGWSGYMVSFLKDMGLIIPPEFAASLIQSTADEAGHLAFRATTDINLMAAAGILMVTVLLVIGVSESANVNNVIVFVKVAVLVAFIIIGMFFVEPENWTPFIPENEGGFKYGVEGIFRAASVVFFAYVGFEAVSTAAAEAKNPSKDMPFGILGSLFICTAIYMMVAAVMTGIVPFRELGVPEPIAVAVDRMQMPWFAFLIKVGAVAGLSSVMLILTYGQSRIFFAMARDGLLPRAFSTVHAKFRTPWIGTIVLGALIAIAASLLPITILGDLVSLGTAFAFGIVCISVLWLRKTCPDMPRPFRAPGGTWMPILGVIFAGIMAAPLIIDIVVKATLGDPIPAIILGTYLALGAAIYIFYGLPNSRLAQGLDILDDSPLPGAMQAVAHGLDEKKK
ncbi:MAG: amino acid permease [Alphaproteobacteria bacterium]|nr:amino acid permease [Alphaproteobacteria bacterium]PHY00218.1 MAG: amino acid permease [Rhodospirillaceae bacterium]